jgi:hypothetical protein
MTQPMLLPLRGERKIFESAHAVASAAAGGFVQVAQRLPSRNKAWLTLRRYASVIANPGDSLRLKPYKPRAASMAQPDRFCGPRGHASG